MILFAVYIFKDIRTWLTFLSGYMIYFLVVYTTPCFLSVVFGSMSFITLSTPGDMRIAAKCQMFLLPTVLVLQDI